jgi:hypothetical protein
MLISGREACEVLGEVGVGAKGARRLLASGLVGTPVRTRSAHLFDAEQVRAVAQRPTVPWHTIQETCPAGIFVARRQVDLTTPYEVQLRALADGWGGISPWTWVPMGFRISHHGSLPFVATVAGFVAFGAEIVGRQDGSRMLLRRPGEWFARLEDHRLLTGPGRPWALVLGHSRASAGPAPSSRAG